MKQLPKFNSGGYRTRITIVFVLGYWLSFLIENKLHQISFLMGLNTAIFLLYPYFVIRRDYFRPHDPDTQAELNVYTDPFVSWSITTMEGQLIVSSQGNRKVFLPCTGSYIEDETKVRYSEYVYVVEVTSGNGDAIVSLTVDGEDEFRQTVACGCSGNPEVLYTDLNTGYGSLHWLIPGFLQGLPSASPIKEVF